MTGPRWRQYKRTSIAELRPYVPGEDMGGISVNDVDRANGSPREGDMIARNPLNHAERWLVSQLYFKLNFRTI